MNGIAFNAKKTKLPFLTLPYTNSVQHDGAVGKNFTYSTTVPVIKLCDYARELNAKSK